MWSRFEYVFLLSFIWFLMFEMSYSFNLLFIFSFPADEVSVSSYTGTEDARKNLAVAIAKYFIRTFILLFISFYL